MSEEHFQYQRSFLKLRISVAKWFTVSKGSNRIVYGKSFDSDQDFKARNANHWIQIGTSALFARCFFLSPPEIKIIQQRQGCVDQRAGNPPRQIAPYIYIYFRGGTGHVRYVPRFGVTVRYDFGTTGKKKKSTMLGFFSFILNRQ